MHSRMSSYFGIILVQKFSDLWPSSTNGDSFGELMSDKLVGKFSQGINSVIISGSMANRARKLGV